MSVKERRDMRRGWCASERSEAGALTRQKTQKTIHKAYSNTTSSETVISDLCSCQSAVHQWGQQNHVMFDPAKEETRILGTQGIGDPFRLLGVLVDVKLLMDKEVTRIVSKARAKLKAMLRTRPFNNTRAMVIQYKAHILPILEDSSLAIYHASQVHLKKTYKRLSWKKSASVTLRPFYPTTWLL